jgi:pyruvate dehydrogenase E2 component (dihydrolipoamide acetyltransferase)
LEFKFPDTGEGVTEGQFLEWKISEGDEVEEDQIVGEAETDKAVVDIPAPADGIVKELKASPGDTVSVGDVIMILDTDSEVENEDSREEVDEEPNNSDDSSESKEDESADASSNTDAVMGGAPSASSYDEDEESAEAETEASENEDEISDRPDNSDVLAMPRVRKKAREEGINLSKLEVEGKITLEDLEGLDSKNVENESKSSTDEDNVSEESENNSSQPEKESENIEVSSDVNATPSVRKLARKHQIELSMVEGSGRGGKITREDVLNAADDLDSDSDVSKTDDNDREDNLEDSSDDRPEIKTEGDVERIKMSGVRKITAERMAQSSDEAATVTHIEKADITELVELRESIKSDVDAHLTYLPFIMKACVAAMREHPKLNSEFDGEKNEIIQKNFYDFNIAVDTERGLMVPKIESVDSRNMVELAEQIADKASRAQDGDLSKDELEPGTFSITNLGVIGGEAFTPIIYPPQSAILGIGKIQETAEVVDGEVVPRKTVKLSLSYDHRVVDGAEAAKFMNKVVEDLENPKNLIIDM